MIVSLQLSALTIPVLIAQPACVHALLLTGILMSKIAHDLQAR